jgi:hypothetical protein
MFRHAATASRVCRDQRDAGQARAAFRGPQSSQPHRRDLGRTKSLRQHEERDRAVPYLPPFARAAVEAAG